MLVAVRGWGVEVELFGMRLELTRRMVHLRVGPESAGRELFYMASCKPGVPAERWCTLFRRGAMAGA